MERMDSVSHFSTAYQSPSRLTFGDALVMGQIGKGLASVYRDVLEEPLPERLASLLKQVDEKLKRESGA